MNAHHAPLIDWGFKNIADGNFQSVLDLGCGGGETTAKLLNFSNNIHCIGLDYSKVAVEAATKRNQAAISEGRCRILKGDVANLPFEKNEFDLAVAVETVYFWPYIETVFGEISRVLTPRGRFLILNEDDGESLDKQGKLKSIIPGINFYTQNRLEELLRPFFSEVQVVRQHPWICVIATK
ncbi:MAG: class I SAM-dependent methyltransferase [bacterium]|nr:class I SAM-dependent methyltransferase [bacterium]